MDRLEKIRARFADLLAELHAASEHAQDAQLEEILTAIERVQESRRRFYHKPFPLEG